MTTTERVDEAGADRKTLLFLKIYAFMEKWIKYLFLKEVITPKIAKVFFVCRNQVLTVDVVLVALQIGEN